MRHAKRKRKYVNLRDKLAAALACLLPQEVRDDLRKRKVPAKTVLALFNFHHIIYHAPPFMGSDRWWNLHPMQDKPHKERSPGDAAAIRKVRSLGPKWREFTKNMASPRKPKKPKSKWGSRKLQGRGFNK